MCFCEFRVISRIYLNFVALRLLEILEALQRCRDRVIAVKKCNPK